MSAVRAALDDFGTGLLIPEPALIHLQVVLDEIVST